MKPALMIWHGLCPCGRACRNNVVTTAIAETLAARLKLALSPPFQSRIRLTENVQSSASRATRSEVQWDSFRDIQAAYCAKPERRSTTSLIENNITLEKLKLRALHYARNSNKERHRDITPKPVLFHVSPFPPASNSGLLDPECSLGVSFLDKLVPRRTNAGLPLAVTSDKGPCLRVERPHVLTAGPSTMVVDATHARFHDGRSRSSSRVDRSCVHWNCRNTRHANKADTQRPNRSQNDPHRVSSFGDGVHPSESAW
jgi:hypothetical protein